MHGIATVGRHFGLRRPSRSASGCRRLQRRRPSLSRLAVRTGQGAGNLGRRRMGRPADRTGGGMAVRAGHQGSRGPARGTPHPDRGRAETDRPIPDRRSAAKTEKGKLLFAGLFETLNSERGAVMSGLERLARSEKALAEADQVGYLGDARVAGRALPRPGQDRRARHADRMEHADFRGPAEIDPIRLRSPRHHRENDCSRSAVR